MTSIVEKSCEEHRQTVRSACAILEATSAEVVLAEEVSFAFRHIFKCLNLDCADLWQELRTQHETEDKKDDAVSKRISGFLRKWEDDPLTIPIIVFQEIPEELKPLIDPLTDEEKNDTTTA